MKASGFVEDIYRKYIKGEELRRLLTLHSERVGEKAVALARDCGLADRVDLQHLFDAAMLHDIGVVECDAPGIFCYGSRPYICHGVAGAEILRREGIDESFAQVCERHTGAGISEEDIREKGLPLPPGNYMPQTLEERLICYADKFYSKSSHPEVEKPMERVEASMQRLGDATLRRFLELKAEFTPTES